MITEVSVMMLNGKQGLFKSLSGKWFFLSVPQMARIRPATDVESDLILQIVELEHRLETR